MRSSSRPRYGAMLIYNHMCAHLRGSRSGRGVGGAKRGMVGQPATLDLGELGRRRLLAAGVSLPGGAAAVNATRSFVDSWVSELRSASPAYPDRRESARRAIEWRERQVKRNRARLTGGPALQTWDGRSAWAPSRCVFAGHRRRVSSAISTQPRAASRASERPVPRPGGEAAPARRLRGRWAPGYDVFSRPGYRARPAACADPPGAVCGPHGRNRVPTGRHRSDQAFLR